VEGCFQHGTESTIYIKCSEVVEQLLGWLLPEKGTDPWKLVMTYLLMSSLANMRPVWNGVVQFSHKLIGKDK
jgi:hypothetical protein